MTRASVDFPQPDSPMMPTVWPRSMSTLMCARIGNCARPFRIFP